MTDEVEIDVPPTGTTIGWTADGEVIVPKAVVNSIRERVDATRRPLLREQSSTDTTVIRAWEQNGDYDITIAGEVWSPPFTTYREYAKYARRKLDEVMDEHGLEMSELDDEIELDMIEQMVNPEDGPGMTALGVFADLPECRLETDAGLGAEILWEEMDGGGPGNNYRSIYVRSPFELSILQYCFDALELDTVIVLGR